MSDGESVTTDTQRPQLKRPPRKKPHHNPKQTQKLVLHVYGMSEARIDSAIQEIDHLCKDAKKHKLLSNAQVQDFVSKMTPEQVEMFF